MTASDLDPGSGDPVIRRIGCWKAYILYGTLGLLLLPGLASLLILELGLIPKAIHLAFPQGSDAMTQTVTVP
jgi:hypothetical protein